MIEHSLEVMKIFFPQWKALDLLCQQDEVHLGVVALLEAHRVTNNDRHLGLYQELEIRLKPRETDIFLVLDI